MRPSPYTRATIALVVGLSSGMCGRVGTGSALEQDAAPPPAPAQQPEDPVKRWSLTIQHRIASSTRWTRTLPKGGCKVVVSFDLAKDGKVSNERVTQSADNKACDDAGLKAVRAAAPFPPIPSGVDRDHVAFTAPIRFVGGAPRPKAKPKG